MNTNHPAPVKLSRVAFQRFDQPDTNLRISASEAVEIDSTALIPLPGDLVTFENDPEIYLVRSRQFSFHDSRCEVFVIVAPSPPQPR